MPNARSCFRIPSWFFGIGSASLCRLLSPVMTTWRTVDPATLPAHFDAAAAEVRWDAVWEQAGIYRWDPARPRGDTFVVDTPPPTVSGSLHVGHCFSYTHPDLIVRQRRM